MYLGCPNITCSQLPQRLREVFYPFLEFVFDSFAEIRPKRAGILPLSSELQTGVLTLEATGERRDYLTSINLPTNSTVARLLAPVDPILIAWSTTTLTVSSPTLLPELPPTLFTNDHRVGNSAEYAASVNGRDNPSAAFASPANKRETYPLTRSNGSEATELNFWIDFSFDLWWFRERGLDGRGSTWCSVRREVSSQKARLSP